MREHRFELFADYFQFYLADAETEEEPDLDGYEAAQTTRVIVQDTQFIALAARNMNVPVTVAVLDAAPECDLEAWDHVVELSISSPSGKLVVAGCTDYLPDAARIPVPAGSLRVRALFGDLDKLSENQLDGDDHYRVELWPALPEPLKITKQYIAP